MGKGITKRILSIFTGIILCAGLVSGVVCPALKHIDAFASDESNCRYLSDMEYESDSRAGWVDANYPQGRILKDTTVNNTKISVKIEGAWYSFDKGMFTHATANVYYNVENCGYQYFTAYVSLDKTMTKNSNGVKFFVYTSNDKTNWTLKTAEEPTLMTIGHEAEFLSVDISGARYLRLHVDPNSVDRGDYAVWADAKLTNSPSGDDTVQSLDYYDNQIKAKESSNIETDESLELLVLQREFVRKVGQYALKRFTSESEANKEVLNWLLTDVDNLREFVLGGDPVLGNYYNSLTVLSDLYRNYKTDLNDARLLYNKWKPDRTYGELYRTMMFSIALTHDSTVGSWLQKNRVENQSDPLRRYAIYRYMYDTERFIATRAEDGTPVFETQSMFGSLTVEEMRWIMYNIIDDESIIWLNDYVQTKINAMPASVGGLHTPHGYIAYTDPNYNNPVFYAEENREYFNDLFAVDARDGSGQKIGMWDTSYTIPGGVDHATYTLTISRGTETDKIQKVWMNFRNKFGTGSVCGGISKSGTNIRGARGIPTTVVGQPGHAAILYYSKNSEGKGYWGIDNNVSGWTLSTKGERHLLGWGNESWQRTHPTVVYFCLAQDALNDYDGYVRAEENVMLAKVYEGNPAKQEQLYEKALTIQPINIDAWYGLIKTYEAKSAKPEACIALAKRVADTMVGYPLPMYNLLNVIKPLMNTTETIYRYTVVENKALTASSVLPNTATDKALQPAVARVEALYLLGNVDTTIADFSFDGENAGCIVLSDRFDDTGIRWKYSLDGKQTWKEVAFTAEEPHVQKLTPAELANITEENDIYILIVGVTDAEENYYKIDISSKPALPNNLYSNDYENKIWGLNERFEWKYANDSNWTAYSEAEPDCSGNKTVEVRLKAAGDNPPSDAKTFVFTEDQDTETRKYVSVSHLSIAGYSSQSQDAKKRPNFATNAIDGNINTYWHTDYGENILNTGNTPYLILKLDSPKYVSGLEFVQCQYASKINIFAKNVKVYVSEDAEHWTQVGSLENLEAVDDLKVVTFDKVMLGQYVKLEITETYETICGFTTVSMVNVYEDATKLDSSDEPSNKPNEDENQGNNNQDNDNQGNENGDDAPKKQGDKKAVKIAVPIAVGVAVVAAAAITATVMIKRKKSKDE